MTILSDALTGWTGYRDKKIEKEQNLLVSALIKKH